jgi:hypothetical protein
MQTKQKIHVREGRGTCPLQKKNIKNAAKNISLADHIESSANSLNRKEGIHIRKLCRGEQNRKAGQ